MAFSLFQIKRKEISYEIQKAPQEFLRLVSPENIIRHSGIFPAQRLEPLHEMRIRQKSDIHEKVSLNRNPITVTEREQGHGHPVLGRSLLRHLLDPLFELMDIVLGRINHVIGHIPYDLKPFPLQMNPFPDGAPHRQGMLTPGFTEAPHQDLIRTFQKKNLKRIAVLPEILNDSPGVFEIAIPFISNAVPPQGGIRCISPDIFHNGHVGDLPPGLLAKFRKFRKEKNGKVIDAEKTDVF
jgi:hypothetical protein